VHAQRYLDMYRSAGVAGAVADADPHALIALLYRGARERIRTARAALQRGDVPRKLAAVESACSIVDGLRMSLDHAAGGAIAAQLDALYDYAVRRLVEANSGNDDAKLAEVDALIESVESGWQAIRPAATARASACAG
jgi:flagellar protein FliS